jgi:hypothetical protein
MPGRDVGKPLPMDGLGHRLVIDVGAGMVMIAAGYAKRAWRWLQQSRAMSWPLAEGRVELTDVGERNWWDLSMNFRGGSARAARNVAALGYSYSVAGTVYSGTYKQEFEVEEDAWEFARRLKGDRVTVHYNPNKPFVSVLSKPSIDALQQTHPPALGGVELKQDAGQPKVESARLSAWRMASWIALATGAWEAYRFIPLTSAHQVNTPQARVRLVLCLAAIAVARFCGWMSVPQRRKATQ